MNLALDKIIPYCDAKFVAYFKIIVTLINVELI
jgi:hypothetical protein